MMTSILGGVGIGVAAFEACYLASDYDGFLPDAFQGVETLAAWAVVCLVLFWRPRGRGDPVGAAVSAQALLGALHALTFPVQDVRLWSAAGHGASAIGQALAA